MTDLHNLCDEVLISSLTDRFKEHIRHFLSLHKQNGKERLLDFARKRRAGPLIMLAIEAFCDSELRIMNNLNSRY